MYKTGRSGGGSISWDRHGGLLVCFVRHLLLLHQSLHQEKLEPPEPVSLALGLSLTVLAALLCVASHAADVVTARSRALGEASGSSTRLERLSLNGPAIRGRWTLLQALTFGAGLVFLTRSVGTGWALVTVALLSTAASRIGHGVLVARASERLPILLLLLRGVELPL